MKNEKKYDKNDIKNVEFYLKKGIRKSGVKNFNMCKALKAFSNKKGSFENGLWIALEAGGVPRFMIKNAFQRTFQAVQVELEKRAWNNRNFK